MFKSKFMKSTILSLVITSIVGCTTHAMPAQETELEGYQQKGMEVKEKSPGLAATLSVLPMAGYFYTGHPVLAITTLPLYPFLGFLWMPADNYSNAKLQNYYATKDQAERNRRKEITDLNSKLATKKITTDQYLLKQSEIDTKYSPY